MDPLRLARVSILSVLLVLPGGVSAQALVQGRVVDDGDLGPIAGAVVSLIDGDGERRRSVFADERGGFVLPLPGPGTYTVRAEMIGRRSVDYLLQPGEPERALLLRLPAAPIQLDGIDVSVERRCSMDPATAMTTGVVWEEVQKALRATSLTASEALYRFTVAAYRRQRRTNGDIVDEDVEMHEVTGYDPFSSLSAEEVHEGGYVAYRDDEVYVYGPSTEVLLSRTFESDHCFGLERDAERGLIGLTFEPAEDRRVPEIEGVLWLDQSSAELRALEFTYRRMPMTLGRGRYQGFVGFRRLDAGSWAIGEWWLRSPPQRRRVAEEAGEILEIARLR